MFKRPPQNSKLDEAIDDALGQLAVLDVTDEGYFAMVDSVEKLMKLRQAEKPERLSRETLAVVAGNLLGIMMIVGHERAHVVTSKALAFVLKSR